MCEAAAEARAAPARPMRAKGGKKLKALPRHPASLLSARPGHTPHLLDVHGDTAVQTHGQQGRGRGGGGAPARLPAEKHTRAPTRRAWGVGRRGWGRGSRQAPACAGACVRWRGASARGGRSNAAQERKNEVSLDTARERNCVTSCLPPSLSPYPLLVSRPLPDMRTPSSTLRRGPAATTRRVVPARRAAPPPRAAADSALAPAPLDGEPSSSGGGNGVATKGVCGSGMWRGGGGEACQHNTRAGRQLAAVLSSTLPPHAVCWVPTHSRPPPPPLPRLQRRPPPPLRLLPPPPPAPPPCRG